MAKKTTSSRTPSKSKKATSTTRSKASKIAKSKKIFKNYETGQYTLESCCQNEGITARTLHNWATDISEISDLYKKAKESASRATKDDLKEKALSSLSKLITGFEYTETKRIHAMTPQGHKFLKEIQETKKVILPNVTAVIFTLKNLDPGNWDNRSPVDSDAPRQVFKIGNTMIEF